MDGLQWTKNEIWMICRYPYFRESPQYTYLGLESSQMMNNPQFAFQKLFPVSLLSWAILISMNSWYRYSMSDFMKWRHTSSVMRNMINHKFHKYVVNSCRYPTNRLILRYLFLNRAMLLLVPGDMVVADNLTRNQRCVGRLRGGTTCHPNAEVESLNGSLTNQNKGLEPTQNVGLAWL